MSRRIRHSAPHKFAAAAAAWHRHLWPGDRSRLHRTGAAFAVTAFVLVGAIIYASSDAAGPFVTGEPESGTLTGNARSVTDATASGGKSVQFASARTVDPNTLSQKFMMGYQGWFLCPGDGSPPDRWVHWFRGNTTSDPSTDMWPDMREVPAAERCSTGFTNPDGSPAYVYSAYNAATVSRHFQWMKDHSLDGVMLQRFTSELTDPKFLAFRNKVAQNVKAGAEQHGRVFNIMYDVSGSTSTVTTQIRNDWMMLVDSLQITGGGRYLKHKGLPLVSIYGFGYADNPGTAAEVGSLIDWFHNNPNPAYRASVMLSVPRNWRTSSTVVNGGYLPAFAKADVISAWSVGGASTDADVDNYYNNIVAQDVAYTKSKNQEFMPVLYPGFSWYNLKDGTYPFNQIPRRGGNLYWRQVYDAIKGGSTMLYGAMFDEVDEGTALFKTAPTRAEQPTQYQYLPLNYDGYNLPSDWYLRLTNQAGRVLRGEIPNTTTIPVSP